MCKLNHIHVNYTFYGDIYAYDLSHTFSYQSISTNSKFHFTRIIIYKQTNQLQFDSSGDLGVKT